MTKKKCGFGKEPCCLEGCEMYDEIYKMCSLKVIGRANMWIGDVNWLTFNKPMVEMEVEGN